MANEYRSEFIMTILSLREIQPGENWEDVAVTAIMRRFHGSSEVAIRADIETIKAWNPSVNWPDMIRRYHRMVRKFSQQFEIRYFARHLCEPMHDPQLTYVLTDILRRTTAPEALIPSLETENHDTSISELAWSIDNDVSRYQSDRLRKLVLEAEAVSPHARRIVREWEELVDKVDHANQSYIGFGYLGTQDQESTRQEEFTRQARSINQRFARQWRGLSVSERQALRPILIEMARFQAGNFPLPEELSRRVHALTSQRSQNL